MITPMAASLGIVRPDHHDLFGESSDPWEGKNFSGILRNFIAFNDPKVGHESGVKEVLVHFSVRPGGAHLTEEHVQELREACYPARPEPCHYVISADGYSEGFAQAFHDALESVRPGQPLTLTLIDRSVMDKWNDDYQALKRISLAQHALNPNALPADVFAYQVDEPDDPEEVSLHFGSLIYQLCDTVHNYHGELTLAEGVASNFAQAPHQHNIDGQRDMAVAAIAIAAGAVDGLFAQMNVDPAVTERTMKALMDAVEAINLPSEKSEGE